MGDAPSNPPSPIVEGHAWRIWREEIPWFFANIRRNHPALARWSEEFEPSVRRAAQMTDRVAFGVTDDRKAELIDAAYAELEAARVDREDGKRILPAFVRHHKNETEAEYEYRPAGEVAGA